MSNREEKLFIYDILDAVDAILEYTKELDFQSFQNDRKTYSAVIREFEIIGEATKNLSKETTSKYSSIEWRDMQDFRNLLIHEYFGVDYEIVWNTVKEDIPKLKNIIDFIISEYK